MRWRWRWPAGQGAEALPLGGATVDRLAPWIIVPMAYLATLALAAGLAAAGAAGAWSAALDGRVTVQLPLAGDPGAAVEAAVAALEALPGVQDARALTAEEVTRMLEPWLGPEEAAALAELPPPTLIDLTLAGGALRDPAALQAAVAEAVPGATVAEHASWLTPVRDLAATVRLVAWLVLGLATGAVAATVVAVTSAELTMHRGVVELLHALGATDGYVAGLFQRHALAVGAFGGAVGLALAVVTLAALGWAAGDAALPEIGLGVPAWLALALVPPAAAGLAMLTARLTVLKVLARWP
jgi:cell division transport system permease protein